MDKQIIKFSEHKDIMSKLCRDVIISCWRPDYVVGITRGGLLPAVMISHYLEVPCKSLDVSLRDGGDLVSNFGIAEDAFNGKKILLVDDINDSGNTFNWIMQDWPFGCCSGDPKWARVWNDNVRFAVVVDNLSSKCKVKMDYTGIEVNKAEHDVWITFPWEEWWTR